MSTELLRLKNIGQRSAMRLREAGIDSRADLEALGAVTVYQRLSQVYPARLTMLWALQGALLDLPYNRIPQEMKTELLDELRRAQSGIPSDTQPTGA